MPAKEAPPGYRCPGCPTMHRVHACFPGCGNKQGDATETPRHADERT